ncbi:MAG: hypothetical protein ACLQAL_03635 [Halobacteriota archaeon]
MSDLFDCDESGKAIGAAEITANENSGHTGLWALTRFVAGITSGEVLGV